MQIDWPGKRLPRSGEHHSNGRLSDAQPLARHEPGLTDQDTGVSVLGVRVRSRRSGSVTEAAGCRV